jgi:hypothetical protein
MGTVNCDPFRSVRFTHSSDLGGGGRLRHVAWWVNSQPHYWQAPKGAWCAGLYVPTSKGYQGRSPWLVRLEAWKQAFGIAAIDRFEIDGVEPVFLEATNAIS